MIKLCNEGGAAFFTFDHMERAGSVVHAFSTRKGGVSQGHYESLNLNWVRGDIEANVRENYARIAEAVGVDANALTLCNYEHGDGIQVVTAADKGKGISRETDFPFCDGLITNEVNVPLITLHADCAGFFYYDPVKRAVGVCHAGWKGVSMGMPGKMVRALGERFGSAPEDVLVGIGAYIMPCCFEVGEEVAEVFRGEYPEAVSTHPSGKAAVDMGVCAMLQLKRAGVKASNIAALNMCTSCERELFYSHRRDRGQTGSMASIIMLTSVM